MIRETIRESIGAMTINMGININAKTLDDRTIYEASEKIFLAMEYQARRRGYKINARH
jgi:hypothetical protein